VHWGEPGHPGRTTSMTRPYHWSTDGIPPLVEVLDTLAKRGTPCPDWAPVNYDRASASQVPLRSEAG